MIKNIKVTGLEMTPGISAYLEDKLGYIDRALGERAKETTASIEIGKMTRHHRAGEVFKAEMTMDYVGKIIRIVADNKDLYLAIDGMKDQVIRELRKIEKKKHSLFRRGGRAIKGLFKGWRKQD